MGLSKRGVIFRSKEHLHGAKQQKQTKKKKKSGNFKRGGARQEEDERTYAERA